MGGLLRVFAAVLVAVAMAGGSAAVSADQSNPKLDILFERLKATDDATEARAVEHAIWRIWLRPDDGEVEGHLALGMAAMNAGAYAESLEWFDRIVGTQPDYAEGWNKRATVFYLLGDFDRSIGDIERTLALEPRHFGALSGLGLIFEALGDRDAALKAWDRALAIHPHLTGARQRVEEIRREMMGKAI